MTKQKAKNISNILADIGIDILPEDIKDIEDIDELREYLEDNNLFDVEVIYYYKAMEYLMEHDNSLTESMELAQDMGYEPKDINSELLASLLASQNLRSDFEDLTSDIEDILA